MRRRFATGQFRKRGAAASRGPKRRPLSVAAQQPRAKAVDKLVRTHHPQAKEKPKEKKEPKKAKAGKAHRPSRAEKHAAKASAVQAASRAPKKSAKT